MASRVTIQDIADALALSRNTVSKAINNTGILADATRDKILKKAIEMGYKQFSYLQDSSALSTAEADIPTKGEICLLSGNFLGNSHFSATMIDRFQREISLSGYSFTMHRILDDELEKCELPISFHIERTAGIICVEMFRPAYNRMITDLGIPTLFVDSQVIAKHGTLDSDFLLMDNSTEIYRFMQEMVARGKTEIGFVGEYLHCQSFYERYMAFRNARYCLGLADIEEYCIAGNDPNAKYPSSTDYHRYLMERISKLRKLPDVFICANDFVAIDLLQVFKTLGIRVPEDIYLCGFDDSPESRIITPALTSIHIHSQIMGYSAAQLLLSRIQNPSLDFRTMYTETTLIYRASTQD